MVPQKKGIVDRLKEGVVVGDGGMIFALEKRGYVQGNFSWTSEASVENPEAVRQLHREFLRAGSDVLQTFTFCSSNEDLKRTNAKDITSECINKSACELAHEVAKEGDALVAGGIGCVAVYGRSDWQDKAVCQKQFQNQVDIFIQNKVDFVIVEYIDDIEEMEWAIEICVRNKLPTLATMRISLEGDCNGKSPAECALRMAKAGAIAVGTNCLFDPFMTLKTIKVMKEALLSANLTDTFLICQPLGYMTPDVLRRGYLDLPEFPFALESRLCTRWDIHRFTRAAYELGVRYIGGCCGFEPYHIRAVSEELHKERGKLSEASQKHTLWGGGFLKYPVSYLQAKGSQAYWEDMQPASGRPYSPATHLPLGPNNPASSHIKIERKS